MGAGITTGVSLCDPGDHVEHAEGEYRQEDETDHDECPGEVHQQSVARREARGVLRAAPVRACCAVRADHELVQVDRLDGLDNVEHTPGEPCGPHGGHSGHDHGIICCFGGATHLSVVRTHFFLSIDEVCVKQL